MGHRDQPSHLKHLRSRHSQGTSLSGLGQLAFELCSGQSCAVFGVCAICAPCVASQPCVALVRLVDSPGQFVVCRLGAEPTANRRPNIESNRPCQVRCRLIRPHLDNANSDSKAPGDSIFQAECFRSRESQECTRRSGSSGRLESSSGSHQSITYKGTNGSYSDIV